MCGAGRVSSNQHPITLPEQRNARVDCTQSITDGFVDMSVVPEPIRNWHNMVISCTVTDSSLSFEDSDSD